VDEMYPRVIGEFATVRRLLKGSSIARFGDGELKFLDGKGYIREPVNEKLSAEMRALVDQPNEGCVIGIPTMDPTGPKYAQTWMRHEKRFCRFFKREDGKRYYSAFITRPDSASDPLESKEYCELMARLWIGKESVVVLSEPDSKLLTCVKQTNDPLHIECPSHYAYALIDDFERAIVAARPNVALLSCGPTATCLANRLAGHGIHAIDMGSVGALLLRWLEN
jgi:hypothetical protein